MDIGDRVRVTKGRHQGGIGYIRQIIRNPQRHPLSISLARPYMVEITENIEESRKGRYMFAEDWIEICDSNTKE